MKLTVPFLLSLIFLLLSGAASQGQKAARFFNTDHEAILTVKEGIVYDSAGHAALSTQGNIIFAGNSKAKEDILFLYKSKDLFSNRTSYLYDKEMDDIEYSLRAGKMFIGEEMRLDRLMLSIEKDGKRYTIYAGPEEQKMGYGIGEIEEIELIAVCLAFTQRPAVKKTVGEIVDRKELIPREGIVGIIKPAWETDYSREWSWDGRKLEPRWRNRPEDEWVFDGEKLKPYWGANIDIGWRWDGEVLRPTWGGDEQQYTYIYDGYTLRPYWDNEVERAWVIEDDMARPKWDSNPSREYRIEGEVPIPVIAIVVLGFADR